MQKVTVRSATVCHDGLLFISACHHVPLAARPPATCALGESQSDTLAGELECGHAVGVSRGKLLAAAGGHSASMLQRMHQRVALGASPGVRGGRLCSQRCAVACEADKIAIVANGGATNGPFLHCSGDSDGHLMPLSPAVRVR